jgi:hypothetical protein
MGSRARIVAPHAAQNPRRLSASLGVRWLCHRFRTAQIQRNSHAPSDQRSSPLPCSALRAKRLPGPSSRAPRGICCLRSDCAFTREVGRPAKESPRQNIAANTEGRNLNHHSRAVSSGHAFSRTNPTSPRGGVSTPAKKHRRAAPTARRPFRRAFPDSPAPVFVRARLQPHQSHFTEGRSFNPAKKHRRAAPTARRPFRRAFTPPRHRRASRKKM